MKNVVILLFFCGFPLFAQPPETSKPKADQELQAFTHVAEAPKPRVSQKQMIIANVVMYGSSVLAAHATYYGTRQCYHEDVKYGNLAGFAVTSKGGGQLHPWRRSFAMTLPADATVSITSWLLRRKHHDVVAVVLPWSSTGMQLGVAGVTYAQGCF